MKKDAEQDHKTVDTLTKKRDLLNKVSIVILFFFKVKSI